LAEKLLAYFNILGKIAELFFGYLAERTNVPDHLINLIIAQLICKCRHIGLSIMYDFVQFSVGSLLNIFRAKISGLQLFTQRGVSRPISPMAKHALGLKRGRARASFSPSRITKCRRSQQTGNRYQKV
jgi:hypothetical protein